MVDLGVYDQNVDNGGDNLQEGQVFNMSREHSDRYGKKAFVVKTMEGNIIG